MTLRSTLYNLSRRLQPLSETASLDAQVLVAHILGRPRAWVLSHPEADLDPKRAQILEESVRRLEAGEPLPYILGHWEFYGLEFEVSPAVLIPRPETELLVDQALKWLRSNPGRRRAADTGTGSGCIAVTLALHVLDLQVVASELSLPALEIARRNAQKHDVDERVFFTQTDLLPSTAKPFDLICANLPYIPTGILETLSVGRWEPKLALDGGPDGLDPIRRLLHSAPRVLAPGGLLLLEIEASQGARARSLALQAFPQALVSVLSDLAGRDRLIAVLGAR